MRSPSNMRSSSGSKRSLLALAAGGILFIGGLNIGVTLGRASGDGDSKNPTNLGPPPREDDGGGGGALDGVSWLEQLALMLVASRPHNSEPAAGNLPEGNTSGSLGEGADSQPVPAGDDVLFESAEDIASVAAENGAATGDLEDGGEGEDSGLLDESGGEEGGGVGGSLHDQQVAQARDVMKKLNSKKASKFRIYCASLMEKYVSWHSDRGLAPSLTEILMLPSRHGKSLAETLPRGDSAAPTVTVILNVFKRELLAEQLRALLAQTAAARIREIWVCVFSAPAEQFTLRVVREMAVAGVTYIRVVASDFNFKFYGRFQVALTAPTDFVYLLDDDMIPGRQHLANLLHAAGTDLLGGSVLGSIGRVLPRPHTDMSLDSYRKWGSHGGMYFPDYYYNLEHAVPVDYLCSQWFLRPEWLQHMWSERPQTFETGEDFHVSHTLRKYGNYSSVLMPSVSGNSETMGSTDRGLSFVEAATGPSDEPLRNRIWMNALKAGTSMRWSDMLGAYDSHLKPSLLLVVASPADAVALLPLVDSLRRSLRYAPSGEAWKTFIFSPLLGCQDLAVLWRLDGRTYCSPKYMRVFGPLTSDPAVAGNLVAAPDGPPIEIAHDPSAPVDGWSHMTGLALRHPEEWELRVAASLRLVLHTVKARWIITVARNGQVGGATGGLDGAVAAAESTPTELAMSRAAVLATTAHSARAERGLPRAVDATLLALPAGDAAVAPWVAGLSPDMAAAWGIPQISIHIITNDRLTSLQRLCASLAAARYLGDRVPLHFHVDVDADAALTSHILALPWPHGPKLVHKRVRRGGLISAVTESFHPASPHEYAVLLEDDIEVSPLFYSWLKFALLRYRYASAGSSGKYGYPDVLSPGAKPINALAGISLYTPRLEEVTSVRLHLNMSTASGGWGAVLFPTPSSWGALYFPESWQALHEALVKNMFKKMPNNIRVNGWSDSWKKYMFSLMYHRNWTFLYPGYENATSFATNHMEAGVHIGKPSKVEHKREDYVVPLFTESDAKRVWQPATLRLPPLDQLATVSLVGVPERKAVKLPSERQKRP